MLRPVTLAVTLFIAGVVSAQPNLELRLEAVPDADHFRTRSGPATDLPATTAIAIKASDPITLRVTLINTGDEATPFINPDLDFKYVGHDFDTLEARVNGGEWGAIRWCNSMLPNFLHLATSLRLEPNDSIARAHTIAPGMSMTRRDATGDSKCHCLFSEPGVYELRTRIYLPNAPGSFLHSNVLRVVVTAPCNGWERLVELGILEAAQHPSAWIDPSITTLLTYSCEPGLIDKELLADPERFRKELAQAVESADEPWINDLHAFVDSFVSQSNEPLEAYRRQRNTEYLADRAAIRDWDVRNTESDAEVDDVATSP
ncbi:MAG: hypothetical protein AAGD00_08355 [Planctomycetota bacterium]